MELLLIKLLLPLLLEILVKSGAMTQIEAASITCVEDFIGWIKSLKTYSASTDFPNPPPDPCPNNLVEKQEINLDYPAGKNGQTQS